jgi:hypothetical protein
MEASKELAPVELKGFCPLPSFNGGLEIPHIRGQGMRLHPHRLSAI